MSTFRKAPVYISRYFREYTEAHTWAQEELNKILACPDYKKPLRHAASVLLDAGTYKAVVEATWREQ